MVRKVEWRQECGGKVGGGDEGREKGPLTGIKKVSPLPPSLLHPLFLKLVSPFSPLSLPLTHTVSLLHTSPPASLLTLFFCTFLALSHSLPYSSSLTLPDSLPLTVLLSHSVSLTLTHSLPPTLPASLPPSLRTSASFNICCCSSVSPHSE